MNTRIIDLAQDYDDVSLWWETHGFKAIPREFLPKTGIMVLSEEGVKLCAGWVYMDNSSPMTWLEWCVTNPLNAPTVSLKALKALIGGAKEVVNAIRDDVPGSAMMLFTCRQRSLARLFEREGFQRTDESVMHMMAVVEKPQHAEALA